MDRSAPVEDMPATWHICWQAAVGRDLFADVSLYQRVRSRLLHAHRGGRVLVDYLLLPHEIHVISQLSPGDTPGKVARAVGNVVARWVRATLPVRSPVFAGPFRAHRIGSAQELRHELRMLAWRPVLIGLCSTPSHHPHSALRTTLGLRPSQGFDARPQLRLFGDSVIAARAALRNVLRKRPSERESREWELVCGLVLATGTVGPHTSMTRELHDPAAAALAAAGGPNGIDGALRLLEVWVKASLGMGREADLHGSRDALAARARALIACLALDHGLCSASSVARHFRRAKATLSEQMAACRRRPADRQILAVPVSRIVEEALALRDAVDAAGRR